MELQDVLGALPTHVAEMYVSELDQTKVDPTADIEEVLQALQVCVQNVKDRADVEYPPLQKLMFLALDLLPELTARTLFRR